MEKEDKGSTLIRIGVSGESPFWYRPTRVVPDQRPLNGRCCCCCSGRTWIAHHLQKSVTQPLTGQNMATVFWDTDGLLIYDRLSASWKGNIGQYYAEPTFRSLD